MEENLKQVTLGRLNLFACDRGFPNFENLELDLSGKEYKRKLEYKINKISDSKSSIKLYNNSKIPRIDDNIPKTALDIHLNNKKLEGYKELMLHNSSKKYIDSIWKPTFKLQRVISGHQGWVRCLSINTDNDFFVSGGADRLIKIWDLASGKLRLTLTGHVATIRQLLISDRHPYMFSCSEDKTMKCWDLETNRVIRTYIGHALGLYALALHPSLDIISTGSRDGTIILWDIRTRTPIHKLKQHKAAISSLLMQSIEPQLVSGSFDKTIKLWDIVAGKCRHVLTYHKKPIRSLIVHPKEYAFLSAGTDSIKAWTGENAELYKDFVGANAITNCLAIKSQGEYSVIISGCDNGQLHFWDYTSGIKYSTIQSQVQPGSLEAENSILCCILDKSETRLITGEGDKTIKVWAENELEMM
ncbi:uncharacterized protein CMU_014060 [Cryptosporidium muris RN66]|uniref:Uncharacterized protein n=1 Tax=Cryptosporidium muris (strain RN66) TaxID=441375 RepID=B6AEW4_CRYMR|nr:uncharacterized protein CMU_014060 [Cryptosporidium muris RN66]EEA06731.1 hypothetical protein, conserved [Cryptosporidium muris RN66]|eukprot:XP_002141080.1 hypothetical protein [Cryptosporidium muris RN66]